MSDAGARRRSRSRGDERDFFLPDFCEAPRRARHRADRGAARLRAGARAPVRHGMFWIDLARTSAFLLWAGLLCAAVLCRARPWLARQVVARGHRLVAAADGRHGGAAVRSGLPARSAVGCATRRAIALSSPTRTGGSCCPTLLIAADRRRARAALLLRVAAVAPHASNSRRARASARCRRGSGRISCSTA